MVAIFKNIWEASVTKNYRPISLLFVVNKVFEKLKNNMLVDHREKFGFFLFSSMVRILLTQRHACLWEGSKKKAKLNRWRDQQVQILKVQSLKKR